MPLAFQKGNLLDFTSWQVLVHQCNAQGKFGAGLARQIRDEYPAAYDAYMHEQAAGRLKLGSLSVAEVPGGKRIINLVAQEEAGTDRRRTDYEVLYCGLEEIRRRLEEAHTKGRPWSLGIPQWIGCGLAGGSPRIVEAMVRDLFEDSPVRCVVVERK